MQSELVATNLTIMFLCTVTIIILAMCVGQVVHSRRPNCISDSGIVDCVGMHVLCVYMYSCKVQDACRMTTCKWVQCDCVGVCDVVVKKCPEMSCFDFVSMPKKTKC